MYFKYDGCFWKMISIKTLMNYWQNNYLFTRKTLQNAIFIFLSLKSLTFWRNDEPFKIYPGGVFVRKSFLFQGHFLL